MFAERQVDPPVPGPNKRCGAEVGSFRASCRLMRCSKKRSPITTWHRRVKCATQVASWAGRDEHCASRLHPNLPARHAAAAAHRLVCPVISMPSWPVDANKGTHRSTGHRTAEVKALALVAAELAEKRGAVGVFDAFGDGGKAELATLSPISALTMAVSARSDASRVTNDRSILKSVEREALEVREACEARSKIIESHANAEIANLGEEIRDRPLFLALYSARSAWRRRSSTLPPSAGKSADPTETET